MKSGVRTSERGPAEEEGEEEEEVEAATGVKNTWMPVPGSRNLENFSAIFAAYRSRFVSEV